MHLIMHYIPGTPNQLKIQTSVTNQKNELNTMLKKLHKFYSEGVLYDNVNKDEIFQFL